MAVFNPVFSFTPSVRMLQAEPLRMSRHNNEIRFPSRRAVLKSMGLAPLLLRPAPFHGYSFLFGPPKGLPNRNAGFPFSDVRLTPHYPAASPLEDVLRLVAPGSDDYVTEKYAWEIESLLKQWGQALKASVRDLSVLAKSLDPSIEASRTRSGQGNHAACRERDHYHEKIV